MSSRHFARAWIFGLLAIASPFLVPFSLQLLKPWIEVGPLAFWSAVGVTAIVCILGIVFAVLTQRQTEPKTLQRRVAVVAGAVSALMLLFWFVSMLALVVLLPRWR